jgi:hypothetical protein
MFEPFTLSFFHSRCEGGGRKNRGLRDVHFGAKIELYFWPEIHTASTLRSHTERNQREKREICFLIASQKKRTGRHLRALYCTRIKSPLSNLSFLSRLARSRVVSVVLVRACRPRGSFFDLNSSVSRRVYDCFFEAGTEWDSQPTTSRTKHRWLTMHA